MRRAEEIEQSDADRDPPECICENAAKKLYNPDCYWHGTEGVEIADAKYSAHKLGVKFWSHHGLNKDAVIAALQSKFESKAEVICG